MSRISIVLGACFAAVIGTFLLLLLILSQIMPVPWLQKFPGISMHDPVASSLSASTTDTYELPPPSFPGGIVSINFDDGWRSAYTTAFPILETAHLPATFYIVSGYLGDGAYMSVSDVLALQAAGEEIGDHTRDHPNLTSLSTTSMQDEIAGSFADLKADGVQSVTTFAYPYGAYDAATDAIVRQAGYAAARTINNGSNSPRADQYLLDARIVTDKTTVAEVEQWVGDAIAQKRWLVLVFHQLNTDQIPNDPYSWPTADFQTLIDYLVANHADVMTNASVATEYFTQNSQSAIPAE